MRAVPPEGHGQREVAAAVDVVAIAGEARGAGREQQLLVDDVPWPIWDSFIDSLWTPATGGVVVVTSLIPLVTTAVSLRSSHEEEEKQEPTPVSA